MKRLFLTAVLLIAGTLGLRAQGVVDFSNAPWEAWPEPTPPNRLVYVDFVGGRPVSDPTWTAQLWELRGTDYVALGDRVPFFGADLEGIFCNDGEPRFIAVPPATATTLQVRIYSGAGQFLGASSDFHYTQSSLSLLCL